jgi:hypothetical protein
MATSFHLPPAQVTLLRQVARNLLMASEEFAKAMRGIAPAWTPAPAPIDPAIVSAACARQ